MLERSIKSVVGWLYILLFVMKLTGEKDKDSAPPVNNLGTDHPGLYSNINEWISATCTSSTRNRYKDQGISKK